MFSRNVSNLSLFGPKRLLLKYHRRQAAVPIFKVIAFLTAQTKRNKSALRCLALLLICVLCVLLQGATQMSPELARWWSYTQVLGSDKLEGRDTGSRGYVAAADYVRKELTKAGLQPKGTNGFLQPVPLHSLRLDPSASSAAIVQPGNRIPLTWFRQITVAVRPVMPLELRSAPLYFAGDPHALRPSDISGAVVVTFGLPRIRPAGTPPPPAIPKEAAAVLSIDSLAGPEPPIWPVPYAESVTLRDSSSAPAAPGSNQPLFRVNPADAAVLFEGSQAFVCRPSGAFPPGATAAQFSAQRLLRFHIETRGA